MNLIPMTLTITLLTVVAACKTRIPNKNEVPEGADSHYVEQTKPEGNALATARPTSAATPAPMP